MAGGVYIAKGAYWPTGGFVLDVIVHFTKDHIHPLHREELLEDIEVFSSIYLDRVSDAAFADFCRAARQGYTDFQSIEPQPDWPQGYKEGMLSQWGDLLALLAQDPRAPDELLEWRSRRREP